VKIFLRRVCAVLSITLFFASAGLTASEIDSRILTTLAKHEDHNGMAFHAGVLWVGKSYPKSVIETFSPGEKNAVTIELSNTPSIVRPYGNDAVIAVGVFTSKEGHTQYAYSIIRQSVEGGKRTYTVTYKELSPEIQATGYTGGPEAMYLSDKGTGNALFYKPLIAKPGETLPEYQPADQEEDTVLEDVLKIEAPGSFVLNPRDAIKDEEDYNYRLLKGDPQHLAGPMKPVTKAGYLYSIEANSSKPIDDNVARVPVKGGRVEHLFTPRLWGVTDLIALDERFPYVIAIESLKQQVHFIDASSGKVARSLPIQGRPKAATQLGNCLLVLANKEVQFFDLKAKTPKVIDTWDFSKYGFEFDYPRDIVVDATSKRVFIQANRDCSGCGATSNSVVEGYQAGSSKTFDYCTAK
jgi:hypothetical protein